MGQTVPSDVKGTDLLGVLGGTKLPTQGFLVNGGRSSLAQQLGVVGQVELVTFEALQTCESTCWVATLWVQPPKQFGHNRLSVDGKRSAKVNTRRPQNTA